MQNAEICKKERSQQYTPSCCDLGGTARVLCTIEVKPTTHLGWALRGKGLGAGLPSVSRFASLGTTVEIGVLSLPCLSNRPNHGRERFLKLFRSITVFSLMNAFTHVMSSTLLWALAKIPRCL